MEALENNADIVPAQPGAGIVVERPEIAPSHLDPARRGAFETARHHHQARLAGAGWPDNRCNLACGYVESNPAQDIDRTGIACHVEVDVGEADDGRDGGCQESSG